MKSKLRQAEIGLSESLILPDGRILAHNITPKMARVLAELNPAELPGVKVNLRSGFWPALQAARQPELRGTVSSPETERAWRVACECGINLIE